MVWGTLFFLAVGWAIAGCEDASPPPATPVIALPAAPPAAAPRPAPADGPPPSPTAASARGTELDRYRAGCAASRQARMDARAQAGIPAKISPTEEYRAKHCVRREHATELRGPGLEYDTDGYLRQERGAGGVEVVLVCPPDGPPGSRGTVVVGVATNASPARKASLVGDIDKLDPLGLCDVLDAEADAARSP